MAKTQKSNGSDVQVDWSGAEEEPIVPANVFAAQANPNFHLLSIGFLAPPIRDGVQPPRKTLSVRVAARFLLTPEDMRELVEILSRNIERQKRLKREKGQ